MIKKIALSVMILFIASCGSSHRMKASRINQSLDAGDYAGALSSSSGSSDIQKIDIDDLDLLDGLNSGKFLFILNECEKGEEVLNSADEKLEEYFSTSLAAKAAKETGGVLVNYSIYDYEPFVMDNLYINNYKILNALAKQDKQGARIEVNRGYVKQQIVSEYYDKEIDKANKEAAKEVNREEQKEIQDSNKKIISEYYGDLSQWRGYKDYMNPYTTYLSGLYFLLDANGISDFETASTYMKRASGMAPKNSFVRSDLRQAEKSANFNSKDKKKYIWVIYENGMVADLVEQNITIPSFIVSGHVSVITFSMPKPRVRNLAYQNIKIGYEGENKKVATELLADVDSMFIAEFKKKLPALLTRATAQAVAKAAMQYAAAEMDNGFAQLGAIAYTLTTSSADLRSWHTLPKEVQIAKIPVKKGKKLEVYTDNDVILGETEISEDGNYIVYVRIPSIMSKPAISIIKI